MIKSVKLNEDNFIVDTEKHEIVKKYDPTNPNLNIVITLEDGSMLLVESYEIKEQYPGSYYFDYNGDRYFIDDDYQDCLIRCGYVVLDDYNNKLELDKDAGIKIRNDLMNKIKNVSSKFKTDSYDSVTIDSNLMNEVKVQFYKKGYKFTVYFSTINNIVTKNQQRKLNELPFFPFDKGMDKYGTIYVSIFCKKIDDIEFNHDRYHIADDFIMKFIKELSDEYEDHKFQYSHLLIKRKIINYA